MVLPPGDRPGLPCRSGPRTRSPVHARVYPPPPFAHTIVSSSDSRPFFRPHPSLFSAPTSRPLSAPLALPSLNDASQDGGPHLCRRRPSTRWPPCDDLGGMPVAPWGQHLYPLHGRPGGLPRCRFPLCRRGARPAPPHDRPHARLPDGGHRLGCAGGRHPHPLGGRNGRRPARGGGGWPGRRGRHRGAAGGDDRARGI